MKKDNEICPKCEGCGQVAPDEWQTPWSIWCDLPGRLRKNMVKGIAKPVTCPACGGKGKQK